MYTETCGIKLPAASQADRNVQNASSAHCIAFTVLGENEGYRVQAESHLERNNLVFLNAQPDVERLQEQAKFIWTDNGRTRRHFFDVLAHLKSGVRIAYTVKPLVRANSDRFMREMKQITAQALTTGFCNDVRLVTEQDIPKIELKNAEIFAAVREPDPEAETAAMNVVDGMLGSSTLRDLSLKVGMSARGYSALIRLIRKGYLEQSLREVISPKALVRLAGGVK